MANTPISGLPSGAPALGTDQTVIARTGANYNLTLTQIQTMLALTLMTGAGTVVDNTLSRWNGTTGLAAQGSGVTLADNNQMSGFLYLPVAVAGATYTLNGTNDGNQIIQLSNATVTVTIADSTTLTAGMSWQVKAGSSTTATFVFANVSDAMQGSLTLLPTESCEIVLNSANKFERRNLYSPSEAGDTWANILFIDSVNGDDASTNPHSPNSPLATYTAAMVLVAADVATNQWKIWNIGGAANSTESFTIPDGANIAFDSINGGNTLTGLVTLGTVTGNIQLSFNNMQFLGTASSGICINAATENNLGLITNCAFISDFPVTEVAPVLGQVQWKSGTLYVDEASLFGINRTGSGAGVVGAGVYITGTDITNSIQANIKAQFILNEDSTANAITSAVYVDNKSVGDGNYVNVSEAVINLNGQNNLATNRVVWSAASDVQVIFTNSQVTCSTGLGFGTWIMATADSSGTPVIASALTIGNGGTAPVADGKILLGEAVGASDVVRISNSFLQTQSNFALNGALTGAGSCTLTNCVNGNGSNFSLYGSSYQGLLHYQTSVQDNTSSAAVNGVIQTGMIQTNFGAVGSVTMSIPGGATKGMRFTFMVRAAQNLIIQAQGTDVIQIGADLSAAAGTATASAIGSAVTLVAMSSSPAATWMAESAIGTWTVV